MYLYSKNSREKVIHTENCFHANGIGCSDIGYFDNLSEAYSQGYRFCKHCNPILKQYRKESERVMEISMTKGLSVYTDGRDVTITAPYSKWKIIFNNDGLVLYHKNEYKTNFDHLSEISGYHFQGDIKKDSIIEYMEYIVEHDCFRMRNPVIVPTTKTPPKKGTKRYRDQQKKMKKYNRKQAICNVVSLIDSLHTTQLMAK